MSLLYDRRYRVTVTFFSGQAINVSDQRIRFNFTKNISRTSQFGEVTIYNLSKSTETDLYKNAKMVTVEAGYQNGAYGMVFQGLVRQPIRGKENGTDYYITLGAIDGDDMMNLGFCNAYLGAGQLPNDLANQIVRASNVPFELKIRGELGGQRTERGKAIFGQPKDLLRSIAINNNAAFYVNNGTANISSISQSPPAQVPELNFQTGMIDIPLQQDRGIAVRTLIRPDIEIDSWVKINNSNIIGAFTPFGGQINPNIYDLDGVYRVIELRATGDTRGNEWYYDLQLLSQTGGLPAIAGLRGQFGL